MILKKRRALVAISSLLTCLILNTAEAGDCDSAFASQDAPNFAIHFTDTPGSINDLAANHPLMVFFRVPDNATSTSSSMSYNSFARLTHFVNVTADQLQAATSGMEIEGINYVVLDLTALGAIASGGFRMSSPKIAAAAANAEKLTVCEAYILDREFTIIALDQAHRGVPSAFASSPDWIKAATLNLKFTSSVYQS